MRALSNAISRIGLCAALCAPVLLHADATQYVGWGDQMLAQRDYARASQYYNAALHADPRSEGAYRGLGYSYLGGRDQAHAAQYFEYALRLNPADGAVRKSLAQIYQGYGNSYFSRGDRANATQWWNKSLQVDPSNTQLSAYVASLNAPAAAAPAAMAAAPAAAPAKEETVSSPGINPWIMGGTVAVLGAVMIFLF